MRLFIFCCLLAALTASAPAEDSIARWEAGSAEASGNTMSALSGADGIWEITHRRNRACIAAKPEQQPPSSYLYFAITEEATNQMNGPLYADVVYFDAGLDGPLGRYACLEYVQVAYLSLAAHVPKSA